MAKNTLEINMYRYNPEKDNFPYMMKYQIEKPHKDIMVLDLLHLLKEQDDSISYRRSCRDCLLYTSPSPRDATLSRMPSSA